MAQLVQLIRADGLVEIVLADVPQVAFRRRHGRHAGARKGDFAGRGEIERELLAARPAALVPQAQQMVGRVRQVVHAVGVVPEDAEVLRRRLQPGEAADRFVGERDAGRVLVFRHAPDALHGRVLHRLLDGVHVGAFRRHRDGNKVEAEILRNGKVAVIAGRGAQKAQVLLLAPRPAPRKAVRHPARDGVEHHVQAGVSPHNHVFLVHFHHIRKQAPHLRKAVGQAVVAAVVPGGGPVVGRGIQRVQHRRGEPELVAPRLAARHVQAQLLRLKIPVLALQILPHRFQLRFRHRLKIQGMSIPFKRIAKLAVKQPLF